MVACPGGYWTIWLSALLDCSLFGYLSKSGFLFIVACPGGRLGPCKQSAVRIVVIVA